MSSKLILLLILLLPSLSWGATYYVDCNAAADGNGSLATPWDAISDINGATLAAGDNVYLKRGCTFREQLTVPNSGSSGSPITIGAYGSGAKPVISGADVVTAEWSQYGVTDIYQATIGSVSPVPIQLWFDGTYYDMAHDDWHYATSNGLHNTIIDTNSTFAEDISGATVVTRSYLWDISYPTVDSYNSETHTITLASGGQYVYKYSTNDTSGNLKTNYGYYLRNKLYLLDAATEWFYDSSAGVLYLWSPGSVAPTGHTVEYSAREYGIYINAKNYINLENLNVQKANEIDIYAYGSTNINITNCDVSYAVDGINLRKTAPFTVTGCTVDKSITSGITTGRTHQGAQETWSTDSQYGYTGMTISNNTVTDIGMIGDMYKDTQYAIGAAGKSITVNGNTINNVGRIGIGVLVGPSSTGNVYNNVISNSMQHSGDGGAIYSHAKSTLASGTKNIYNNTIYNVVGSIVGTTGSIYTIASSQACGIYADGYCNNINISNNLISTIASDGIFWNAGTDATITYNKIYSAGRYALKIVESGGPDELANLTVSNNRFESLSTAYAIFLYTSKSNNLLDWGTLDYNQIYTPNCTWDVWRHDTSGESGYTLANWLTFNGNVYDSHSSVVASAEDPKLTDTTNRIFRVMPGSPCIRTGNPTYGKDIGIDYHEGQHLMQPDGRQILQ